MGNPILMILIKIAIIGQQSGAGDFGNRQLSMILTMIVIVGAFYFIKTKMGGKSLTNKEIKGLIQNFESRMNNRGFTKRIVVYDFLSDFTKEYHVKRNGFHWWTVGIWIDYRKQLVALRPDKDTWYEVDIPFNKIQSVEIIEDGYLKTIGGAIGYGAIAIGSAKSKEISKELKVRIVTGDINGTQAYFLKLYDPEYGTKYGVRLNKSHEDYKSIEECARSIVDEIENIIRYAG